MDAAMNDGAMTYRKDLYFINRRGSGVGERNERIVPAWLWWLMRLRHPRWKTMRGYHVLRERGYGDG